MTEQEMLTEVKKGLKELSNYNDDEILLWIRTAIKFLENAGVKPNVAKSESSVGAITLCVNSLRNREVNFSEVLKWQIVQLAQER